MKIIEVLADSGYIDTIRSIAEQFEVADIWQGQQNDDGRVVVRLLVSPHNRQQVLDKLQTVLMSDAARIIVTPVEAVMPKPEAVDDTEKKNRKSSAISREELFSQIERGAQLNTHFLLLVVLSGIVASVGLLENNVAVIVGAMVIAPLLGPNMGFSLGTSLGEKNLVIESLKAISAGIILAIGTGYAIGLVWEGDMQTPELLLRTTVFNSGTVIALASGAAASLSLVTSVSSVLVGVMVAVALMPPAVTIGLMLSAGLPSLATGAALTLAINIVCINLSAKVVFLLQGLRPRTWLEARKARQSQLLYISIWIVLLALLTAAITLRHKVG